MEKEVVFLALTIATELPVAMFVLGKRHWWRTIAMVMCLNFITHPIAWQLAAEGVPILPLEIVITLVESALLAIVLSTQTRRALLAGCAMNLVSAAIGVLLF